MKAISKIILSILLTAGISIKVQAAVHYVSPTGTATYQESTNINTPCALSTANSNASASDTVYLRGGTYDNGDYIHPQNSGISENARITYSNYNSETVTITDANYGILIDSKSYITVYGLDFYYMGHFLYITNNANHNIIGFCTFDQARDTTTWGGSKVYYSSQYNWVHHCSFSRWGYANDASHAGALFDVGNEFVLTDSSYYNLIEDNTFFYGGHHCLAAWSKYSIFRNNYLHHERSPIDGFGYRCAITHGLAVDRNLFEGNRFAFAHEASGMSLRSSNNIFRFNTFYNNGLGGIQCVSMEDYTPAHYNHIYNNVFFNNGHQATYSGFSGGIYFCDWGEGDPTGNVVKNNIFYNNAGGAITTDAVTDPQVVENNWETGDPLFVYEGDGSDLDPFGTQADFSLQAESECIDSGAPLKTITSPGGSGTQFEVTDAGYFIDGWNITEGDEIQLAGSTERARITNVSYETNEITVVQSISWTQGQGVCLSYAGSTPDIGAYEYGADGGVTTPFNLQPNYPNPFNRTTTIPYTVTEHSHIKIAIYDLIGREIKVLMEGYLLADTYAEEWDGTDTQGNRVRNGIYFCHISGEPGMSDSKKIIFLK